MPELDQRRVAEAIQGNRARLWRFIRSRIPDPGEAEDILQEVFSELFEAYRAMKPIERAGAWMLRVARNRITDWYRKKRPQPLSELETPGSQDGPSLADLLPSPAAGPDAAYLHSLLVEELADAIAELTPAQRYAFLGHEVEGRSFAELAAESGTTVNSMISRKHRAVLHLRRRLERAYADRVKGDGR